MVKDRQKLFVPLLALCLLVTFCVIVVGAYVRLTDAGLGCPDWPGCYGKLVDLPSSDSAINEAQSLYPGWQVDTGKVWREMIHRYLAAGLGLLVLALVILGWNIARRSLLVILSVTIIFQALLGMWTVTLMLQPIVVMMHLLGGFAVLSMLWWIYLDNAPRPAISSSDKIVFSGRHSGKRWLYGGLTLLVLQIALGGWTSANYAALACPDFPTCAGQWVPPLDYEKAFLFEWQAGKNYEYGTLDNVARSTIHFIHRVGALVVVIYFLMMLGILSLNAPNGLATKFIMLTAGVLLVQVGLGISNVLWVLPLPVAVGHNGGAAILLLCVLLLIKRTQGLYPQNR